MLSFSSLTIHRVTPPCCYCFTPSETSLYFFWCPASFHFLNHLVVLQIFLLHDNDGAQCHDTEEYPCYHDKCSHAPQFWCEVIDDGWDAGALRWTIIYVLRNIEERRSTQARTLVIFLNIRNLVAHLRSQNCF